jgi:hypothetical protein
MSNPSDLSTALISIGSAVAGGGITGLFTLWVLRRRWHHERDTMRQQRSDDAARHLLIVLGSLDRAICMLMADPAKAEDVRARYNDFAFALSIESVELRDLEIRNRLEGHMLLGGTIWDELARTQQFGPHERKYLAAWRAHNLAMSRALTAHRRGEARPDYNAPNTGDLDSILKWSKTAELPR